MNFEIGQIFEDNYPPEAAVWANESGEAHIEEIASSDGVRRWQIVKNASSAADLSEAVRRKRDVLLSQTDFLVMPDYPIDTADLEAVKTYRQALRNVPQQAGFPIEVQWPDLPSGLRVSV